MPEDRLTNILVKVAFADHIRLILPLQSLLSYTHQCHCLLPFNRQLQTTYRDNYDSQLVAKQCRKYLSEFVKDSSDQTVRQSYLYIIDFLQFFKM